jgi:hypothetical protein
MIPRERSKVAYADADQKADPGFKQELERPGRRAQLGRRRLRSDHGSTIVATDVGDDRASGQVTVGVERGA